MTEKLLTGTLSLNTTNQVPNFKIVGAVVPEKSLTKKKVYIQTHTQTLLRKRQKLYNPYILRIPGV